MDVKALASQFWEQGYLVIDNFFDAALMDKLDQINVDHFGDSPEYWHNHEFLNKAVVEVIPWFPQEDGVTDFDEVQDDPRLSDLTEAILGEGWYSQYCMVMFSKQGSKGQAWHQDCPPEDAGQFNLNRLVYTSDITPEIGGQTVVVPHTYDRGLLTIGDPSAEMPGQIVLTPKKGTLVLLHGHNWHRVLPVKGKYRVSTNYRSAPKGTPEDITDICVYRNMRYQFSTSKVVEERKNEQTV